MGVLVRVVTSFCAGPGLDVARGQVLEVPQWIAQAWSGIGHVALLAEDPSLGAGVVSGFVHDYNGVRVVPEEELLSLRGPGEDDPEGTGGRGAELEPAPLEEPAAVPEVAVEQSAETAAVPAEGAAASSEESTAPAEAVAVQHPEAGATEAVTSRAPRTRNRDPRR